MDNRNSFKGYSSAADSYTFASAADAYAKPSANPNRYSQQRQMEAQRASMYSQTGVTPSTSASALAAARGAPSSPPTPGGGSGRLNAWAPVAGDDDDEDEDDQDGNNWNVYDDFNNARPAAAAPAAEANPYAHPDDPSRTSFGSSRLYAPAAASGTPVAQAPLAAIPRSGTGATLSAMYGGQRQSLLPREAFGFDVQNSDPRAIRVDPYNSPDTPLSKSDSMGAFLNEKRTSGYQNLNAIETAMMPSSAVNRSNNASGNGGIELVTVPALGSEFTKDEMKGMARKSRRRAKVAKRTRKVGKWASGEEKVIGLIDRRLLMILTFAFLAFLGLLLFFVIPRVPSIAFLTVRPMDPVPNASGMEIGNSPANFSGNVLLNLRADNTAGFIPSRASKISVVLTDVTTGAKVGKGVLNDRSFAGRKRTPFQLPVELEYVSRNLTGDSTFALWHSACGPIYPNAPRPTLTIRVSMTMKIAGLLGTQSTGTQLNDVACPFTLRNDQ